LTEAFTPARAGTTAAVYASTNVRHLSRSELPGGGQILMTTHPWTHSHKVRVVGDLMVVNSEIEPGAGDRNAYPDGGFRIYDIRDRANPKLITFVKTHARGVHRFDMDETYAYISTEMEGFVGNILVIYDIRHPASPREVSRWWMPGQNIAAGEAPHPRGRMHMLHHAMRSGNELYAGCWFSGVSIIDVADITRPRTLSHYEYDPPCAEPTHTFLKVPFLIGGRSIAVSTEEERGSRGPDTGKPHAQLRTWDVTDTSRKSCARITWMKPLSLITAMLFALGRTSCAKSWIATACSMSPGLQRACA
jgi:hypothetical protein